MKSNSDEWKSIIWWELFNLEGEFVNVEGLASSYEAGEEKLHDFVNDLLKRNFVTGEYPNIGIRKEGVNYFKSTYLDDRNEEGDIKKGESTEVILKEEFLHLIRKSTLTTSHFEFTISEKGGNIRYSNTNYIFRYNIVRDNTYKLDWQPYVDQSEKEVKDPLSWFKSWLTLLEQQVVKGKSVDEEEPIHKDSDEDTVKYLDHFRKESENYQSIVTYVLEQEYIQSILNTDGNYFDLAYNEYYQYKNLEVDSSKPVKFTIDGKQTALSFYDAAIYKVTEYYKQPKNRRGDYGRFIEKIGSSNDRKLFEIIGELISYIDRKAYNINNWNKYPDNRAIARSTVKQNNWVINLLRYKQHEFELDAVKSPTIRNALLFFQYLGKASSVLSERHRALITEKLFKIPYVSAEFNHNLKAFFQYYNISLKQPVNEYVLYSYLLYNKNIRAIWDDKMPPNSGNDISDDEPEDEEFDNGVNQKESFEVKAEVLADNIAIEDELGRKELMGILFDRVNNLWDKLRDTESFTILLNGEWGSGKSSMLYYFDQILNDNSWAVVKYNAWENQRFDDPWWILVNKVSKEVPREAYENSNPYFSRSHRYWKSKVQFSTTYIVAFVVSVLLIIGFSNNVFGDPSKISFYGSIVALLGSLWVTIHGTISNLFKKKSNSAIQAKHANDPYEPIKNRFNEVVKHKRVAIFIDDLDRCEVQATVKLLEGIQTLFKSSKVLYVIAADSAWVAKCFDEQYKQFSNLVQDGQTIGNEFLQKTFQLIVDVPKLSVLQQEKLLTKYLDREEGKEEDVEEEISDEEIEKKVTVEEVSDASAGKGAKTRAKAAKQAEKIIEKRKRHLIQKIQDIGLIPLNIRQMKRLINLFTLKVQVLIIAGTLSEVGEENVLRYVLFASEYPAEDQKIKKGNNVIEENYKHKKLLGTDLTDEMIRKYL